MKGNVILAIIMVYSAGFAQVSINSSSGEANGVNATISYTVGQLFGESHVSKGAYLTEGVHQPFEISSTLSISPLHDLIQLQYYPNPVKNTLNLIIPNWNKSDYKFSLYDFNGRLLKSGNVTSKLSQIQFHRLPAATYILKINSTEQTVKAFTIQKN
jgi:hypothetical protein